MYRGHSKASHRFVNSVYFIGNNYHTVISTIIMTNRFVYKSKSNQNSKTSNFASRFLINDFFILYAQHNDIVPSSYNSFSSLSLDDNQWENVIIPGDSDDQILHSPNHINNHHPRSHKYYVIKNLLPATNYEVRVQGRNDFGWNKLSNILHFSTLAEGKCIYIYFNWLWFEWVSECGGLNNVIFLI